MCDLCPEIERRIAEHEARMRQRNRDDYAMILGDAPLTDSQVAIWETRRRIVLATLSLSRAYDAIEPDDEIIFDLTPLLDAAEAHRAAIRVRAEELVP